MEPTDTATVPEDAPSLDAAREVKPQAMKLISLILTTLKIAVEFENASPLFFVLYHMHADFHPCAMAALCMQSAESIFQMLHCR